MASAALEGRDEILDTHEGHRQEGGALLLCAPTFHPSESCPSGGLVHFDNAAGAETKDPAHFCCPQGLRQAVAQKKNSIKGGLTHRSGPSSAAGLTATSSSGR